MQLLTQFHNLRIHNQQNLESRTLRTEFFIWSKSSLPTQQISILSFNVLNKKCFWENLKKWENLYIKCLTNKILILKIFNNYFNIIKLFYCTKMIKLKEMAFLLISLKFLRKSHLLIQILFMRPYCNFSNLLHLSENQNST